MDNNNKILKFETNRVLRHLLAAVVLIIAIGIGLVFVVNYSYYYNLTAIEATDIYYPFIRSVFAIMIIIVAAEHSSMVRAFMLAGKTRKTIFKNNIFIMAISTIIFTLVASLIMLIIIKRTELQDLSSQFTVSGYILSVLIGYLLYYLYLFSATSLIAYSFKKSNLFGIIAIIGEVILMAFSDTVVNLIFPKFYNELTYRIIPGSSNVLANVIGAVVSIIGIYFVLKKLD